MKALVFSSKENIQTTIRQENCSNIRVHSGAFSRTWTDSGHCNILCFSMLRETLKPAIHSKRRFFKNLAAPWQSISTNSRRRNDGINETEAVLSSSSALIWRIIFTSLVHLNGLYAVAVSPLMMRYRPGLVSNQKASQYERRNYLCGAESSLTFRVDYMMKWYNHYVYFLTVTSFKGYIVSTFWFSFIQSYLP